VHIDWLGHAGFRLRGDNLVVYIDPYNVGGYIDYEDQADVLLITHEHFDHCSPQDIQKVRKSTTTTLIPTSCSLQFRGDARRIEAGDVLRDELAIKGLNIEVVAAYNIDKPFHPAGEGVGYVIELEGLRIYHAGDTDLIDEMASIEADIVLLPIGGYYTMDEKEAAEAVSCIKPAYVIPMHYGSVEGTDADTDLFKKLVEKRNKAKVIILENNSDP
jgi:L-ascorbate metabolism protein UlaG (beta-lactamase superfamily)